MDSASESKTQISKLEETQAQVDQVVGIMRANVEKVLERDEKLRTLDSLADNVLESGKIFEQRAQQIKRKYWWKNLKMWLILIIVVLIIVAIIIGAVYANYDANKGGDDESKNSDTVNKPKQQNLFQHSRSVSDPSSLT